MAILIVCAIFGAICALVANAKGRSPIGWFFIGFVAPMLGIILVFVLPDLKEAERRYNRLGKQNRLLRERLRQSRVATRKRLSGVNRRLTAHDRSLDMDTSQEQGEMLPYTDDDEEDDDEEERPAPAKARGSSPFAAPQSETRNVARVPQRPAPGAVPGRPATVRVVQPGTGRTQASERTTTEQAPTALPVRPVPRRRPS